MGSDLKAKKRIVVVCPGRGSYSQNELGYLRQWAGDHQKFVDQIDTMRVENHQPSVTELDRAEKFSAKLHTPGENASALIYACSLIDFLSIDRSKYEIVAITGNSMGWYLALAFSGALNEVSAFKVINTMGTMMKDGIIGGQIIYPLIDEGWIFDPERKNVLDQAMATTNKFENHEVYYSIHLGGYAVIGGQDAGLRKLMKLLPPLDETYPMRLLNHAAFHTPLLKETSHKAFEVLGEDLFQAPEVPLVDGRGAIWQPYSTDVGALRNYTLGHQVYQVYDYSKAIEVTLKEFVPDHIVMLGPGSSLGGATAQILIRQKWKSLVDKSSFVEMQKSSPFLLAMGREDQRSLVT